MLTQCARSIAVAIVAITCATACGGDGVRSAANGDPENSRVDAVNDHIAAAKAGDVEALRSGACGDLAAAMEQHTDDEVREEFIDAYDNGPDFVEPSTGDQAGAEDTIVGIYEHVTDLNIAFLVEDHDGWKVCAIRRGNGMFGPLPGPFE